MSATVKRGLYWALTALQVTQENVKQGPATGSLTAKKSYPENQQELSSTDNNIENVRPAYTREEVADHCHSESFWMIINNKVYDLTRFLRLHPGGEDIMLEYGGHDATSAFIDKGHSLDAYQMLPEYYIGEVTKADWLPERDYR